MSRLIHEEDDAAPRKRDQGSGHLPLTIDTIALHLRRCQTITLDHVKAHFVSYRSQLEEAFNVELDNARSNQDVSELSGYQRQFRLNWQEFETVFYDEISNGFVKFKDKKLGKQESLEETDFDSLSLVDNQALEESITIKSVTTKIDAMISEPLWSLNQRLSLLNGGEKVDDAGNPASPFQLCECLRKAIRAVPNADTRAVNIALKAYADGLNELAKNVVGELNDYLVDAGVLPNLKMNQRPKPKVSRGGVDSKSSYSPSLENFAAGQQAEIQLPDANQPPQVYQLSLVNAIRGLQHNISLSGEQIVGVQQLGDNSVAVITAPQVSQALQNLQLQTVPTADDGNLHNIAVAPTIANSQAMMQGIQLQLQQAGEAQGVFSQQDGSTIDLVGMLFEYMLKDDNIPDSVKAILSYLHTPFLKIAFSDPKFFEQSDHPARVLLNDLAEAGSKWVGNDGTAQYDVLSKIKSIVDRILSDYQADIDVVITLLNEFDAFVKNIARRQELMEKRAMERAKGEQRLREVKIRVNQTIQERTAGQELPSPILLFLLQPWSDYMSFVLLRHGDESDAWTRAIGVVDDVLWAIQPQDDPEEVVMQSELKNRLVASVEAGLETIGFDQVKGGRLIEAITSLIDLALNSKQPEPAPADLRSKLEKMAAEKAGNHDLEKVEAYTDEEKKVVEHLQMIEYGTWFEFEGGRRLKVAWFNRRTMHYMLVDQMGKKVATMSGPELAREIIARKARILSGSSKPFFERALENIFQNLSNKETGDQAEGGDEE